MKIIFDEKIVSKQELQFTYDEVQTFSGNSIYAFGWLFQSKVIFWEDIYFQLMASMRKMKIKIPLTYTPEMFENSILLLAKELGVDEGGVKVVIFKKSEENTSFCIELFAEKSFYSKTKLEVDIYREIVFSPNLCTPLLIPNYINNVAVQYAEENNLDELVLLNNNTRVARALQGNYFCIKDRAIISNPISEGALVSAFKKNFIDFLNKKTEYIYKEEELSPFQLLSAEEVFILGDEVGVASVTKMRKTVYSTNQLSSLVKRFIGYSLVR